MEKITLGNAQSFQMKRGSHLMGQMIRACMSNKPTLFLVQSTKNGGGIMVWAMVLPNGLLSFKILKRDFKSHNYMHRLMQTVVPISLCNKKKFFLSLDCDAFFGFAMKRRSDYYKNFI